MRSVAGLLRAWVLALGLAFSAVVPAEAEYEVGQIAWDAGRPSEALAAWQSSAEAGDGRAMLALGRVYARGLGVPQDFVEAHKWLNLAAGLGSAEAATERDALANEMTAEERAEARKLARAWWSSMRAAADASDSVRSEEPPAAEIPASSPPERVLREAQGLLATLGYEPGPADGIWGPTSVRAYQSFLRDTGLTGEEVLTADALRTMQRIAAGRSRAEDPVKADDGQLTQNATEFTPTEPVRQALPQDVLIRRVQAGDVDGVTVALEAGAGVHINLHDDQGWTALMHAARKGDTLLFASVLDARPDLDTQAVDGATALFIAVLLGHEEVAEMLVRAGADVSIAGPNGKTPLDVAQVKDLQDTVATLQRAAEDHTSFLAAEKSDTAAGYDSYIKSFPYGLFVETARERRDAALDREAFQKAEAANTAESHRDYLTAFPAGAFRETAERLIVELDTAEFDRAVRSDSSAAYTAYINSNPNGLFIEEAKHKGRLALDRERFQQAEAGNTEEALEAYLGAEPEGAYRAHAQTILRGLRDPVMFSQAKETHTVEAYSNYLELYPDGQFTDEARQELARLKVIGMEFRDCENCPVMVVVPPGSFVMGSDKGRSHEQPRHKVTIAQPFAVGKYEVTLGQFEAFVLDTGHDMGEKVGILGLPASGACTSRRISQLLTRTTWREPGYSQDFEFPVVCINWNDAAAYAKWLSEATGKPYRLLSESEWEYAARANTSTSFYFGEVLSTNQANYNAFNNAEMSVDRGYRGEAIRAGSFQSNPFGLHDMHGNVLEWVEDCWHGNYEGAPRDGAAWTSGGNCSLRIMRGGSWFNHARLLRSASRSGLEVESRYSHYGLRVARMIEPQVLLSKLASSSAD